MGTSTLKASTETASALPLRPPRIQLRALNRIKVGRFAGLSVEEFRTQHPDLYADRERDRLNFRFPEGESYLDLAQRLQPAIIELERIKSPVVIISHRSVLRVLRNYFTGSSMEQMPYMQFPQHSVCKLSMGPQGVKEEMVQLLPDEDRQIYPGNPLTGTGSNFSPLKMPSQDEDKEGSIGSAENMQAFDLSKQDMLEHSYGTISSSGGVSGSKAARAKRELKLDHSSENTESKRTPPAKMAISRAISEADVSRF